MSQLSYELHFSVDLVVSDVVDNLQAALWAISPDFCDGLRVFEYERDRAAVSVDVTQPQALRSSVVEKGVRRGEVYDQLQADSPPVFPRRFGSVLIRGKAPSTFLTVRFDEMVPAMPMGEKWLFSNSVSGQVGAKRIGRLPRVEWVRQVVGAVGDHPSLLWGAAFDREEFAARNLHDDSVGMWALGRDVRRSLPGLFWMNLFGRPYIDLIGRRTLEQVPGTVDVMSHCVGIRLYQHPEDWSTNEGGALHGRLLDHLGRRFFFDRNAPDRETVAPDFGLRALPQKRRFQVLTTDGERYTPLPGPDDDRT